MDQNGINVIMLAGGLRASMFRQQLGIPTLCLPMGHDATLLDAWLKRIAALGRPCNADIVVSSGVDLAHLQPLVARHVNKRASAMNVRLVTDPAPWRGTGGLLKDVARDLVAHELVMVVESSCLPPPSLQPALDALREGVSGVVCCARNREPAGVYVFRRSVLDLIPDEGFYDLKEQFVPLLYGKGRWLACAIVSDRVPRLRDRSGYLRTLHGLLNGVAKPTPVVSDEATVAPTARLIGACVVEPDVVVEDDAVVHESVLMRGAKLGTGSVVSRSIIGRNAIVPPRGVSRDAVVPFHDPPDRAARMHRGSGTLEPATLMAGQE